MKTSLTISPEQLTTIYNAQCQLNSIATKLDGTIHPDIQNGIVAIREQLFKIIQPTIEAQDKQLDLNIEEFSKIQQNNDLFSIWSYFDIEPKELGKKHSFKNLKSISYYNITIEFDLKTKPKTWLELWKISDQLMRQSADTHHCFLEGWTHKDGNLKIITGS